MLLNRIFILLSCRNYSHITVCSIIVLYEEQQGIFMALCAPCFASQPTVLPSDWWKIYLQPERKTCRHYAGL